MKKFITLALFLIVAGGCKQEKLPVVCYVQSHNVIYVSSVGTKYNTVLTCDDGFIRVSDSIRHYVVPEKGRVIYNIAKK